MKKIGIQLFLFFSLSAIVIFNRAHAEKTIWYVHPDSSLNSIQAALDSCADNDIVLVAPGIYVESIRWPNTQGIQLISALGSEVTKIDGDSIQGVITINTGVDTTTIIRGFTIQNGNSSHGGGILCDSASSPIISENIITANEIYWDLGIGGGIGCRRNSCPVISDNLITQNAAYGPFNDGFGGGIGCDSSSPIIVNNIIFNNIGGRGGGIGCIRPSSPIIKGNTIDSNVTISDGRGGGIGFWGSSPIIKNNIITRNKSTYGAGIYIRSSPTSIIDSCTISNNMGDGVYCFDFSLPTINYCNIFGNSGYGVINTYPITIDAQYNWWGDATGPFHPDSNLGGLGDSVSDYVDFIPWLGGPVGVEQKPDLRHKAKDLKLIVSPNPFTTVVRLEVIGQGRRINRNLTIYDVTGRAVRHFILYPSSFILETAWDGKDSEGKEVPPGIYFLKLNDKPVGKVVKVR